MTDGSAGSAIGSLDWELLADGGTKGHWKYSVRYTERLSGLAGVTNYATAHYEVIPAKKDSDYVIRSTHSTCFYTDFLCREFQGRERVACARGGRPPTTCALQEIESADQKRVPRILCHIRSPFPPWLN